VTAAAAGLKPFSRTRDLIRFLLAHQGDDGSWQGYWWADPAYATCLAAEAITSHHPDPSILQMTNEWGYNEVNRLLEKGGPGKTEVVRTAHLMRILALDKHKPLKVAAALTEALANLRHPGGGWDSSARLRIPPPSVLDPGKYKKWIDGGKGGGAIVHDHNGYFTTATVMIALNAYANNNGT
jgi:squalene cyclase